MSRVAIVGCGGIFPGAPELESFWRNIEVGRDAARDVPPGRWLLDPDDAYDAEIGKKDHVYSKRACFVEDFKLDPEPRNAASRTVGQRGNCRRGGEWLP